MNSKEYEYLQRAVELLGHPKSTVDSKIKVLKTMSQICERAAKDLEMNRPVD